MVASLRDKFQGREAGPQVFTDLAADRSGMGNEMSRVWYSLSHLAAVWADFLDAGDVIGRVADQAVSR